MVGLDSTRLSLGDLYATQLGWRRLPGSSDEIPKVLPAGKAESRAHFQSGKALNESICICRESANKGERWGLGGEKGSRGQVRLHPAPPPQALSLLNEPQRGRGAMQTGAMETE